MLLHASGAAAAAVIAVPHSPPLAALLVRRWGFGCRGSRNHSGLAVPVVEVGRRAMHAAVLQQRVVATTGATGHREVLAGIRIFADLEARR